MTCLPTIRMRICGIVACLWAGALTPAAFSQGTLHNGGYTLDVAPDGVVAIHVVGMPPQRLAPEFSVLHSDRDPRYLRNASHPNYPIAPRIAIRWAANNETPDAVNAWLRSPEVQAAGVRGAVTADANGDWLWEYRDTRDKVAVRVSGPQAKQTSRPFTVGECIRLHASGATVEDGTIRWAFAPHADFKFGAELRLPPEGDPQITFTLTPRREAFYSVAFTGSPDAPFDRTIPVPQECEAHGHRLSGYVMCEADLRLPRAHVATADGNVVLVADPRETPFRLPTPADSRFGIMLQREAQRLKPLLLAPLLGGAESRMAPGRPYRFTLRCVVRPGDWKETYRHVARTVCGLRDQRDNSGPGPLNGAIERTMDFLADRNGRNHALWHDEQKYYDYYTDQTGVYKPFSPLFGLSAAIVTDDEDFYRRRARPAVEFALSRKYNLFAPYEGVNRKIVGSAQRDLGGSYLGFAQLLGLHEILQRRVPVVRALAEESESDRNDLAGALARWRLSGDRAALDKARQLAETAIARGNATSEQALFDLLELHDATHDPRHLEGAVEAAYHRAAMLNLSPAPPDTMVTVDRGGIAPVHPHSFGRHRNVWGFPPPQPLPVPEQTAPAWRIARLGLPSTAYPIEYWMNTHGALMRVAALGHDDFLRDVARWGMVGRFGNYPGDNRSIDSLVGERPDAVDRPPWEWNFATVNPGHAWDFVAALLDFLVSDAFERSHGAIDFPADNTAGSSFRVRVYGARPGRFYGDENVRLWLPRGLLTCDSRQFDWLAGYGNGRLYVALWNQSFREETATVRLNPAIVELDGPRSARTWIDSAPAAEIAVRDGAFDVRVPAKGIVALAIPQAHPRTRLQARLFDPRAVALGAGSFASAKTPLCVVRAMVLTAGRGLTSAFVYTDATPENVICAKLRWRQGQGPWREATDEIFPYEFSPELDETEGDFECIFEMENAQQIVERTPPIILNLSAEGEKP